MPLREPWWMLPTGEGGSTCFPDPWRARKAPKNTRFSSSSSTALKCFKCTVGNSPPYLYTRGECIIIAHFYHLIWWRLLHIFHALVNFTVFYFTFEVIDMLKTRIVLNDIPHRFVLYLLKFFRFKNNLHVFLKKQTWKIFNIRVCLF